MRAPRDGFAPGHYLVDAWRGKLEFAEIKRKVIELNETWHPHSVIVEDAASGVSLIQELRAGTTLPIKPFKPDRDKYQRIAAITPILEARRLLLPETAWWREAFIAELTAFPASAHDDWCDALAMALNHLREDSEPHALTHLKLQQAAIWVREGLSVDAAALRADLPSATLREWLEHPPDPISPNPVVPAAASDDKFAVRVPAQASRLIEAFRAGCHITGLDPDHYHSYLRPQLLMSADPAAAKLVSELDRRFGLG